MKAEIRTIPQEHQRYATSGDYFKYGGVDMIFVSDLGNPDFEFLVALHEFIEMYLCQKRGIKEEDITAFDKAHPNIDPGMSKDAPYHKEHLIALSVERFLCKKIGVDFDKYEKRLEEVCP